VFVLQDLEVPAQVADLLVPRLIALAAIIIQVPTDQQFQYLGINPI